MVADRAPETTLPLTLPASAATLEGFQQWNATCSLPREVSLTYRRGAIFVESAGLEVRVPVSALKIDGFRRWALSREFPPQGRIAFIDGRVQLDMSPEELQTHNAVKTEITRVLGNLVHDQELGELFSDRAMVSLAAAEVATEPDGAFVSWQSIRDGTVKLVPRDGHPGEFVELQGAPDLVWEVVSRYSITKDTQQLRKAYFNEGVREYWIINALGNEIEFAMLTRADGDFEEIDRQDGWLHSPTFDRGFWLERRRNPVDLWRYTLHVSE